MKKNLVGIVLGAVIAFTLSCASNTKSQAPMAPSPAGAEPQMTASATTPRDQIARLDAAITADMEKLGTPRPVAPPLTCVGDACSEQMTSLGATAAAPATCPQPASATCSDVCKLKDSICTNATSICRLATEIGGTDATANDKCNQGNASCEAAKQRCCGCL